MTESIPKLVWHKIDISKLLEQHHEGNESFKIAETDLVTLTAKTGVRPEDAIYLFMDKGKCH